MSTLNVTSIQNPAAPQANISLNADGTVTLPVFTGGSAPALFQAGTLWYNTTASALQIRNAANTTWVATASGGGGVTSVTASAPLAATAGATPDISLTGTIPVLNGGTGATTVAGAQANLLPSQAGNPGKLLSTDGAGVLSWVAAGGTGTVTGVTGTLPITVATGTTTPVIAINAATTALPGSVQLADAAASQAGTSATLVNTPAFSVPKDAAGMAGAALLPGGNDAARPSPVTGMVRYNNQGGTPVAMEYYDGANWSSIAPRTGGRLLAIANFDGTTATPTIRSSANVSSITTIATAQYRISFINPAQNSNYALSGSSATNVSGSTTSNSQAVYPAVVSPTYVNKTTTSMDIMASLSGANNVWDVSVIFTTI